MPPFGKSLHFWRLVEQPVQHKQLSLSKKLLSRYPGAHEDFQCDQILQKVNILPNELNFLNNLVTLMHCCYVKSRTKSPSYRSQQLTFFKLSTEKLWANGETPYYFSRSPWAPSISPKVGLLSPTRDDSA